MFFFALTYNFDRVTHHVIKKMKISSIGDVAANFLYIDNGISVSEADFKYLTFYVCNDCP